MAVHRVIIHNHVRPKRTRDSRFFKDYREAHQYAVQLARQLGREVGIERTKEYDTPGFSVFHLPDAKNRYGFELRAEVVRPTDPL